MYILYTFIYIHVHVPCSDWPELLLGSRWGDRRPTVPGRPWAAPGQRSMLMLERSMLMPGAGDVMVGAGGGWSHTGHTSPTSRYNTIYIL